MKVNSTINIPVWLDKICVYFLLTWYRHRFGQSVCFIRIKNFHFAIVDKRCYNYISQYKWRLNRSGRTYYAFTTISRGPLFKPQVLWMHHLVLPPPDGYVVDHKNHNGLDNRDSNVRLATPSENLMNARKTRKKTSSRYKGVDFVKPTGKWRARIVVNGVRLFLGSFDSELKAALAYDAAAKMYYGEYACLNFK